MPKRSYGQYCALARAFDVVGERWTPLLLRELAMGPRRYADLQEGLAGVGTSLLSERLKELEAEGIVVKRFLSPPAARWVYDLTDDGRELAAAMVPLARWGVKRLGTLQKGETFSLSVGAECFFVSALSLHLGAPASCATAPLFFLQFNFSV